MQSIFVPDSELLSSVREEIDAHVRLLLCSPQRRVPAGLIEAMRQATQGGKRLRALLVVGIVGALRGDAHNGLCLGAAVEMVHAASLAVDDLPCMDNATRRRGRMALHLAVGEDGTILAALALVNLAYEVLATLRAIPAKTIVTIQADLASTLGRVGLVAGQWEDLKPSSSPADIEYINLSKTGVLFEFAARCAGVLCGADAVDLDKLATFGRLFGVAYQMLDDARDAGMRRMRPLSASADNLDQNGVLALSEIRQVLETAEGCARGRCWHSVARAFTRPTLGEIDTLEASTNCRTSAGKTDAVKAKGRDQHEMN